MTFGNEKVVLKRVQLTRNMDLKTFKQAVAEASHAGATKIRFEAVKDPSGEWDHLEFYRVKTERERLEDEIKDLEKSLAIAKARLSKL